MIASRSCARITARVLESSAAADTVRHFTRANLSDRDDDLVHEEMLDRFGDGYMCVSYGRTQRFDLW
jgi:hypothetical protein